MKHVAVVLSVLLCFSTSAFAVLRVASTQATVDPSTGGIKAQAIVTEPTARPPGVPETLHAVAIVRFTATILIRDTLTSDGAPVANGLAINKHVLTEAQAWGKDQPNGYVTPPPNNVEGPWVGLMWPFRDQNDYFNGPFDPPGNDVGDQFDFQPGLYGFANINGITRGGPNDPDAGPPSQSTADWLLRGQDGNGVTGPASYFAFDVKALFGPEDREIEIKIVGAHARVLLVDNENNYSEVTVPVDDFSTFVQLPEPASIATLGAVALGAISRRRRR